MGAMLVRHEPASASAVRRELAQDLELQGVPPEAIDDVTLVATELVCNAIRHGAPAASDPELAWTVDWRLVADAVVFGVEDPSDAVPVPREAGPHETAGRGLAIVAALAADWGFERTDRGKRVWAKVKVA